MVTTAPIGAHPPPLDVARSSSPLVFPKAWSVAGGDVWWARLRAADCTFEDTELLAVVDVGIDDAAGVVWTGWSRDVNDICTAQEALLNCTTNFGDDTGVRLGPPILFYWSD